MNLIIPLSIASLLLVSCKPAKEQANSSEPAATPTEAASTPAASTTPAIPYPLDTCLVSGEKLGSMGKPPEIIYEGRQIKFCCKSCIPDFKEDPAKYLSKLK